ncbi:MAG TPA: glycosyltransferase family A protein [Terriglobia bacterium]|nr:glycosyltransferase family A protein [Terriglobia bacterium]
MTTVGESGAALEIEDGRQKGAVETHGEAATSQAGASRPLTVSIIISNCNYARFLGEAIDSALGQTHAKTEVVVVDDGSTDNSRQVIESRGERVHGIFKSNGGHVSALNAGFAASTGDLILFLDSDDVLEPDTIEIAVREWREGMARLLFPLEVVDKDGKSLGRRIGGQELPSPVLGSFGVGSPTSGNVFSRAALEKMLPIPEVDWRACPDVYLTAAGLFGEVKCLRQPLARYRVHGSNNLACGDPLAVIRNRIELDFKLYYSLFRLTEGKIGTLDEWIGGCPQHWVRRIVSRRENPCDDPWQGSLRHLTMKAIQSTWRQPQRNLRRRLAYSIFAIAYSTLPRRALRFLQEIDGGARGGTFRRLLGT